MTTSQKGITVSLAGTSIAKNLTKLGVQKQASNTSTPSHQYLFSCPEPYLSKECKFHSQRKNPGPTAWATEIMDHIRIYRHNKHLDGSPLTPEEEAAVSTNLDPWGSYYVRSGNNKELFLPGGLFNDSGFALMFFPNYVSPTGEKGDWDIVTLVPLKVPVPSPFR